MGDEADAAAVDGEEVLRVLRIGLELFPEAVEVGINLTMKLVVAGLGDAEDFTANQLSVAGAAGLAIEQVEQAKLGLGDVDDLIPAAHDAIGADVQRR